MNAQPLIAVDLPRGGLRKGVWMVAAITALTCHMALAAFAILHDEPLPQAADLGAPGLEIAFEIASLPTPVADPGPASEVTPAAPPTVQETTEAKPADLPMDRPVEAEDPERLVTLSTTKAPTEPEPAVKVQKTKSSEPSIAREAKAAPTVRDAPRAPRSTTRAQGSGESLRLVRAGWQNELMAHLNRFKRYPDGRNENAQIKVAVEFDRTGRVLKAAVAQSSGDSAFDMAAVSMVRRASPVPAPPPMVADAGLSFTLPLYFNR